LLKAKFADLLDLVLNLLPGHRFLEIDLGHRSAGELRVVLVVHRVISCEEDKHTTYDKHGRYAKEDRPLAEVLAWYRTREWTRIAVGELRRNWPLDVVHRQLSDLAETIIEAASRGLDGLCIIALGKLGSRELNFSSDIDIVFVHEDDDLYEEHARNAQSVVRLLSGSTGKGWCYRVDLDLRPEGKQGALVNSIPAMERYYEMWGQGWERLAWMRARPLGPNMELGNELLGVLRPFAYPRSIDANMVELVCESCGTKLKIK